MHPPAVHPLAPTVDGWAAAARSDPGRTGTGAPRTTSTASAASEHLESAGRPDLLET